MSYSGALQPGVLCARAGSRSQRTAGSKERDPYEWSAWPRDILQRELEIVCKRLKDFEACRKEDLENLYKELEGRTIWALQQDRDIQALRERVKKLDATVEERTQWALRMDQEFQERTAWALQLDKELQALRAGESNRNIIRRIAGALKRRLVGP